MSDPQSQRPPEDRPPQEHPPTLDYRSPRSDKPQRLSGGQLFGQAIGGILVGIALFLVLILGTKSVFVALAAPITIGSVVCFFPRSRGLGIGLIIALPVVALIGLGICFITGDKI